MSASPVALSAFPEWVFLWITESSDTAEYGGDQCIVRGVAAIKE